MLSVRVPGLVELNVPCFRAVPTFMSHNIDDTGRTSRCTGHTRGPIGVRLLCEYIVARFPCSRLLLSGYK